MTVLDAENKIAGRLATNISRRLKDGEEVKIVNAEKAVLSGNKEEIFADYKRKYERGSRDFGPHYPKRPDKVLKRIIRGMLPDNGGGADLLSNVKTYLGTPERFEDDVEVPDTKEGDDLRNKNYVKLGEVSKHVGWTPKGDLE